MKTLLIGGNRFVGVEMIWQLLNAGHELTVLALDSPPAELRSHVRWLRVDRNDGDAMARAFGDQSFDCVVDNIAYVPAHIKPLLKVLEGRIDRYLLTSTTDVYPKQYPRTWREDEVEIRDYELSGLNEGDRYNFGKRSCEALLQQSGLAWNALRPCMVTGPRDNLTGAPQTRGLHWFEQGARSHFFVSRLLDGGPILLYRNDETVFNLAWVGDVAGAVAHVLQRPELANQAFNVAGDEVWTNERLVMALARAGNLQPEIVHVSQAVLDAAELDYTPVYGSGASWSFYENQKLKATGWRPTPADQWLPRLLEADPSEPHQRLWYHSRVQEISLARHLQRRTSARPVLAARPVARTIPVSASGAALPGQCSTEFSAAWRDRALAQAHPIRPRASFYREFDGRVLSGIGIGTWMGDLTAETDRRYVEALVLGASRGLNVFDTAINYRHMKAERCVGQAVHRLATLGIPRQSLCICSKGGFITHDADSHLGANDFLRESYLGPGLIDADERNRLHSLRPAFIVDQLAQSRANLGLETIDVYYLHNPEIELPHLGQDGFYARLRDTFIELEKAVAAGHIGCYGLGTWEALRVPATHEQHLSLERTLAMAIEAAAIVGLQAHHLRALQFPFNVRDHQTLTLPTQQVGSKLLPALEAAQALGLYCFTSASVLQGGEVPLAFRDLLPGFTPHTSSLGAVLASLGIGTALAGMRRASNIEEALALAASDLPAAATIRQMLNGDSRTK